MVSAQTPHEMELSVSCHDKAIISRYETVKDKIFSQEKTHVSIASRHRDSHGFQVLSDATINGLDGLQEYLEGHEPDSTSDLVIMIPQEYSWGRLCITNAAFQTITETLDPFSRFIELISTYGFRTNAEERPFHGWRGCALTGPCHEKKHAEEICYNIQYYEKHGRNLKDLWSLRQMGIYHQYCSGTGISRWILINPSKHLRSDVMRLTSLQDETSSSTADKMRSLDLHAQLLLRLGSNWSEYVEYLTSELAAQNDKACYSSLDCSKGRGYTLSYVDLQELHMLQARVRTAAATLASCIENCKGCRKHLEIHTDAKSDASCDRHLFDTYEADMARNLTQVQALEDKLECTLDLLTKLLMFRNEELLHTSNQAACKTLNALLDLSNQGKQQQETLNGLFWRGYADSAMLKVLSIVATVCLPASLVATIFSSNLVQAGNPQDHNGEAYLVISHQFWVYIAISLPLMAAVLAWILYLGYKSRQAVAQRIGEAV